MSWFTEGQPILVGKKQLKGIFRGEVDRYRYSVTMEEGPQAGATISVPKGYVKKRGK